MVSPLMISRLILLMLLKIHPDITVLSEIQWTSFFFFKMSLMISFLTEILRMHILYHRLIYNCMFEHLRLENKSRLSCKIKQTWSFSI